LKEFHLSFFEQYVLKWKLIYKIQCEATMVLTLAVLNTTDLQSGRMLTDHAGRSYHWPWNSTVVSFAPQLAKKAAQEPDLVFLFWVKFVLDFNKILGLPTSLYEFNERE